MAVGIACTGTEYENTGYAYIETTNFSFIGVPPDGLAGGVVLHTDPIVIQVDEGTKIYGRCDQTRYLHEMYMTSEKKFSQLSQQADTMKTELQVFSDAREVNTYNQRVPVYNDLISKIRQYSEIHNYILTHQYDRKGTYEWVKSHTKGL
jgi:hypothetical protein